MAVDVASAEQQGRPLGQMERLLNARRSWSGAMTTAHVSAAVLEGPPPTEAELLQGLAWVLRRHPMLAACVRGKSKFHIPDAQPYPMHSDYLGRAVAYNSELMRTYPDDDIQRFAPSPLSPEELAARALRVVRLPAGGGSAALDEAWRVGFDEAMDGSSFDEDGDGPLWRITLYAAAAAGTGTGAGGDEALAPFWERARECNAQTRRWIGAGWARESLLLFASGWEFMNMNRVVELGAQDRATLGRAYSAGVSNVGVYAHPARHGDLALARLHFGISQTVSAPSISVSAVTVQGRLCLTVQYATPVWPEAEAERYADDLVSMLRLAAAAGEPA